MRFILVFMVMLFSVSSVQTQPTEIVLWHHFADDARAEFLAALADDFNATHESVRLRIEFYPTYDNQHDAILSALVNGGTPNIAFIRNFDAALYQLSGALADLNIYADETLLDAFYPLLLEQDVLNGERLGIPMTRAFEALYVNMDALRQLGYRTPPTTRDELASMACDFRNANSPEGTGFDMRFDASFILAIAQPNAFFNENNIDFSPLADEALYLRDLLSRGCAGLRIGALPLPHNRFASGETLFYMDSTAARAIVEDAILDFFVEPFELAIVPLPSQSAPIGNVYGPSLSIFQQNPDADEAAWTVVEWLLEPEQIERWAAVNEAFPARQDVTVGSEWAVFENIDWYTEPNFPGYDLVRDELTFAMRAIWAGEAVEPRIEVLNENAMTIFEAFVGNE